MSVKANSFAMPVRPPIKAPALSQRPTTAKQTEHNSPSSSATPKKQLFVNGSSDQKKVGTVGSSSKTKNRVEEEEAFEREETKENDVDKDSSGETTEEKEMETEQNDLKSQTEYDAEIDTSLLSKDRSFVPPPSTNTALAPVSTVVSEAAELQWKTIVKPWYDAQENNPRYFKNIREEYVLVTPSKSGVDEKTNADKFEIRMYDSRYPEIFKLEFVPPFMEVSYGHNMWPLGNFNEPARYRSSLYHQNDPNGYQAKYSITGTFKVCRGCPEAEKYIDGVLKDYIKWKKMLQKKHIFGLTAFPKVQLEIHKLVKSRLSIPKSALQNVKNDAFSIADALVHHSDMNIRLHYQNKVEEEMKLQMEDPFAFSAQDNEDDVSYGSFDDFNRQPEEDIVEENNETMDQKEETHEVAPTDASDTWDGRCIFRADVFWKMYDKDNKGKPKLKPSINEAVKNIDLFKRYYADGYQYNDLPMRYGWESADPNTKTIQSGALIPWRFRKLHGGDLISMRAQVHVCSNYTGKYKMFVKSKMLEPFLYKKNPNPSTGNRQVGQPYMILKPIDGIHQPTPLYLEAGEEDNEHITHVYASRGNHLLLAPASNSSSSATRMALPAADDQEEASQETALVPKGLRDRPNVRDR